MRMTKVTIGVFAVILFVLAVVSIRVSSGSSAGARLAAYPHTSKVLIADGSDPLPKPWHKFAA